ncbi:MAG: PAS domain S-box protein [Chitinophagaceae bacterium]|nr:PAS domain S-box protein [Chitinophagaceae bacterium]
MATKKNDSKKGNPQKDTPLTKSSNLFPVVGIGASAGGLDAFKKLLKAIPENSGMAYVLVQHLDPSHESMLPELLQKVTNIPVLEVADDIKVVPDHIYIIPSNKMLISNDGVLELSPRPDKNKSERHLPIDFFFTSLAEVHQSHAIGVVLSGTASDGTLGLKAIKDHGGITFAQDEASAAYEGMPNSAVQAGVVDFILPPEKIPQKLLEVTRIINGNGRDKHTIPPQDEDVYKQILSLLRIRKGTDFTYYKQTTIRRRILRRMALNKNEEPADYLKYLRENKTEQDILYQDLLIPVTSFFRDPKVFEHLCESVFPLLVKNKTAGEPIRLWIAGCSTGEEVYSIAICLREFLGFNSSSITGDRVQIFATDISEPGIAKARAGIYKKSDVSELSPQRLQEFFTKTNGSYQVNKLVRDMCVFAVHNFLKDPPFGKMDFISCRNVLIYMEPYLQKKALSTFHYALNHHGFLLLGKSETTSGVPDLFASVNKADKLFTRKDVPGKYIHTATQRSEQNFSDINTSSKGENIRTDFQKTADEIMLSKYTPAGVVVNEAMDIVHFRGSTGNFLEPSPGKASFNLLKMAKDGLAFELRNILHKAKKDNKPVLKENIPLPVTNPQGAVISQRMISIEAIPLPNIVEPHYLILFHDNNPAGEQRTGIRPSKTKNSSKSKKDDREIRTQQLEKELAQIREDMRSITEEQEAANEELQSANEELLSSSEEMQSLNEEMETSKEELQSTNEELMVVNQEMMNLNEQVSAARDYAEAIILTIREPLVVLDKNLRVKSANNSFYKTFQVIESEIEGRLIIELNNKQWNIPELLTLLEEVLPQKTKIVDFEVTMTLHNKNKRVMLLNAREILAEKKEENLILLAIEDITERREAEAIIKQTHERFRQLVKGLPASVFSTDATGHITFYNDAAVKLWGRKPEIGKDLWHSAFKLFNADGSPLPIAKSPMAIALREGRSIISEEIILERADGSRSYVLTHPQPEFGLAGEVIGGINMLFDITEEVIARKKVELSEHRYHNLIFSSPTLIAILKGEDMIIEIANDAILEQWGKGKDVIGKSLLEVLPEIVDQDLGKRLNEVYQTGTPYYGNELPVYINYNGTTKLKHYTFIYQAQRDLDDKIEGVAIISNEVTPTAIYNQQLKRSEAYFRQMSDLMPQKVWTADAQGNYNYVNKCWLDYTGLTYDELKDWGWEKTVHPDDWEETKIKWQQSIRTGKNFEMEHRFVNTEGIYKWHLTRGLAQKDEGGKIVMWIGTNTEMQQIKEEEQRRGDFIKMVSHELKTPVTSIKGYVQLLLMMTADNPGTQNMSPVKDSLTRIDRQVVKLTRLIAEMLDLSRIEANRLELQKEVFSINTLVEECLEDIRYTSPTHAIDLFEDFSCMVNGDKGRIEQVIINLVANAIKYSPSESHIEVRIKKAPKNQLAICIKDYGIGIEISEHKKIFERFYRVGGKSEITYPGFGIGLFISNEIIERHEGHITLKSETGKGAVFTINLPVASENDI